MKQKDMIITVNEDDKFCGYQDKLKVHKNNIMHRAFSVFVFNSDNQLLIQKRNSLKYHSSGLWSNSCCSHYKSEENIDKQVKIRLKEEMGFECEVDFYQVFRYSCYIEKDRMYENEMDYIFIGFFDGKVSINTNEVSDYKWIEMKNIANDIRINPNKYTYWFRQIVINNIIDISEIQKIKYKLRNKDRIDQCINKGIDFLNNNQGKNGCFKGYCFNFSDYEKIFDANAEVGFTNYILWNLIPFTSSQEEIKNIIDRGCMYLYDKKIIKGESLFWNWTNDLPPDFDDTIIAYNNLKNNGYDVRIDISRFFRKGYVNTWDNNIEDIDYIVQLNAINSLSSDISRNILQRALNKLLNNDFLSDYYLYPKAAFLYHLCTINYIERCDIRDICLKIISDEIKKELKSVVRLVYIVKSMDKLNIITCKEDFMKFYFSSLDYILNKQNTNGSWKMEALFKGPRGVPFSNQYGFGSNALSTSYVMNLLLLINTPKSRHFSNEKAGGKYARYGN